ncbi:restriction endonuclease subunit S [Megamonas sp. Calf98-2]|uniref:restriction endonuclease subunit S n=1 Tax=Megamonas TaxID=158846 RepID=UPI0008BA8BA7|nr:restriction endonuclease subunit S [Megamonas sp. Calf98-2]SEN09305.1 type I restriction enzyme, S subunit [Megamonas sp. Calf98-2]
MNIPKLRFKEFTDEWQIKKLDKNTYIKARVGWKNLKASEYVSSGIPMIAGQHIKQGKILWDKVDFITNERYDESPEIQLKNNDIIFSKDGSLGNPAIIKNMPKKATINGTMMLIRLNYINDNVSPNYFYQICNSQYFKKMVSLIKSGGTVPHIFQRDIINFTFPIPKTLEEQEKIANFLSIVDKKVENLKNTITSLENQKKGLLQQIFSQKLRFKDKNGNNYPNWEKKKLEDIAIFLDNKRKPLEQSERIHGKYPYYGASGIIDYVNNYIFDEELILLSEDGANIIDRNYPICYIATGKYWVNNHAHVLKTKSQYLNKFLCEALERLNYNKYNTGTAQPKLNQDVCRKIILSIPCLEEQTKIADFLSAFDRKLDNQKAQLEHWQQIKKGLLQQMFV